MNQIPAEMFEWHICENSSLMPTSSGHRPIRIGPFATQEECRVVLKSLSSLPVFAGSALEVHKTARGREKRIRIKLAVRVSRLLHPEIAWDAYTVDISRRGARLSISGERLQLTDFLDICYGPREAIFRVIWVGLLGTPTATHVGLECMSPETNIWDLDLSAHTDDEPLMQEIVVAHNVQRRLFPRQKPHLQTLDYSGKCVQARTVGGDYYDFLDLGPGHVGFVLADIAGKGLAAALLMSYLQGSIHSSTGTNARDLPEVLSALNRRLYEHTDASRYASLFFGCYDDEKRSLAYVNCGHIPPLLLRDSDSVERLEATATVLGLFDAWEGSLGETLLHTGDLLSIFTDGVTETTSMNGDEFGESRLLSLLKQTRNLAPEAILNQIEQAVKQFGSAEHSHDDLTMVVARAR